jgi:hypothetical protein
MMRGRQKIGKCFRIMGLLLWACSSAGRAPALQAGGRRFDPGHVHQLNSRSLNHLRCFFLCTTLVQIRDNRDNRLLFEIRKSESVADSLRFIETYLHFVV